MKREAQGVKREAKLSSGPDVSRLTPHASLTGLSKPTLARLAKLNITSKFDLALHLPLRYDDETDRKSTRLNSSHT